MTVQIAMVGRAQALAALDAVSAPALILVGGEAGIGKTRLVAGMRPDGQRFVGRCSPLREPLPLGPVVEALGVAGGFPALRKLLDDAGQATLVIEDLHWADNATWEFLRYRARGSRRSCGWCSPTRNKPGRSILPPVPHGGGDRNAAAEQGRSG